MATKKNTRKLSQSTKDKIAALPPKKRKYAENRLRGMSKAESARRAGYSKHTALRPAEKIETPDVTKALQSAILDLEPNVIALLGKRAIEGLSATKTEFFSFKGEVTEARECVDYAMRDRAVKTVGSIFGVKGIGHEVEVDNGENVKVRVLIDC